MLQHNRKDAMANKDKGGGHDRKTAAHTLKEKRQAKKAKKDAKA